MPQVRPFLACTAATCMVYISSWLQPYIVNETPEVFRTSPSRAGLVLTVELVAVHSPLATYSVVPGIGGLP
jgi:hypothetical protein